jgi:DNA primase small subunit
MAFANQGELLAMLVKEGPSGVYSSNSYYLEPTLPMHEKGWKGADLIFDIDADALEMVCKKEHDTWVCRQCGLEGLGIRPETCPNCHSSRIHAQNWGCEKCIGATKAEAFKLLEILAEDFGMSNEEIAVHFSGNFGFHISVESKKIEELDNLERAEIAEYMSGKELIIETLGIHPKLAIEEFFDSLPTPLDPGWRGRIARYFRDLRYNGNDRDEGGMAPAGAPRNIEVKNSDEANVREKIRLIFKEKKYDGFVRLVEDGLSMMGCRVDPSVTMDIHRIFRLGGTLNGKTGLLKMNCTKDLESFEPLKDAAVLDDEKMKIFVDFAPKFQLREEMFGPYKSQLVELPAYAAVYLMCREAGRVES